MIPDTWKHWREAWERIFAISRDQVERKATNVLYVNNSGRVVEHKVTFEERK